MRAVLWTGGSSNVSFVTSCACREKNRSPIVSCSASLSSFAGDFHRIPDRKILTSTDESCQYAADECGGCDRCLAHDHGALDAELALPVGRAGGTNGTGGHGHVPNRDVVVEGPIKASAEGKGDLFEMEGLVWAAVHDQGRFRDATGIARVELRAHIGIQGRCEGGVAGRDWEGSEEVAGANAVQ
ncbi:uncharacterized protein N7477_009528 [Penicillium maclennaniae]|uniref:uncharacterized protein n=1 Tax=Penicillium maclennaniae TaxID=1343394 RepID=UPI002540519F|nr:uncharacterized protein N7477_009528 [Penicillium maclennaniae]KAJ5661912.1 hypothetical protein N7477_009528 [Penicillium maclennaniae]